MMQHALQNPAKGLVRHLAAFLVLASPATAQARYDFNHLNGSDTRPFTALHGQDGWRAQSLHTAVPLGVTRTLSHDGTPALRFEERGAGFQAEASRINDANWSYKRFDGSERRAYFQADMLIGVWNGSFGLAHDTDGNGVIRYGESADRGVEFDLGERNDVQITLRAADGTESRALLGSAGLAHGNWARVRVEMDFTGGGGSGLGYVFAKNLTTGAPNMVPVPGLQGIPLALDQGASDANNPLLWDAMWLRLVDRTYGVDNIVVGDLERYDFNHLAGSDTPPYTPLDGQDGWSARSMHTSVPLGVTRDALPRRYPGAALSGKWPGLSGRGLAHQRRELGVSTLRRQRDRRVLPGRHADRRLGRILWARARYEQQWSDPPRGKCGPRRGVQPRGEQCHPDHAARRGWNGDPRVARKGRSRSRGMVAGARLHEPDGPWWFRTRLRPRAQPDCGRALVHSGTWLARDSAGVESGRRRCDQPDSVGCHVAAAGVP